MDQSQPDPHTTSPQSPVVDPVVPIDVVTTKTPDPIQKALDQNLTLWDRMHPNDRELTW